MQGSSPQSQLTEAPAAFAAAPQPDDEPIPPEVESYIDRVHALVKRASSVVRELPVNIADWGTVDQLSHIYMDPPLGGQVAELHRLAVARCDASAAVPKEDATHPESFRRDNAVLIEVVAKGLREAEDMYATMKDVARKEMRRRRYAMLMPDF